jgi:hypothetical protein
MSVNDWLVVVLDGDLWHDWQLEDAKGLIAVPSWESLAEKARVIARSPFASDHSVVSMVAAMSRA